jgi:hypothetical protein
LALLASSTCVMICLVGTSRSRDLYLWSITEICRKVYYIVHYFFEFAQNLPKESSYNIPAFVIFCLTTIVRMTSGIMSAGGLICIRYFCFSPSKFRHCLIKSHYLYNPFKTRVRFHYR